MRIGTGGGLNEGGVGVCESSVGSGVRSSPSKVTSKEVSSTEGMKSLKNGTGSAALTGCRSPCVVMSLPRESKTMLAIVVSVS